MKTTLMIDVKELPTRLPEVLSMVGSGEKEILLMDRGVAVAQLVPLPQPELKTPRISPLHPGAIILHENFDDPLTEEFGLGEG